MVVGRADDDRHPRPGQPVLEVGPAQHAGEVAGLFGGRAQQGRPRPVRAAVDVGARRARGGAPARAAAARRGGSRRAARRPLRREVVSAIDLGRPEPGRRVAHRRRCRRRGSRRSTGRGRRRRSARRRPAASSSSSSIWAGSVSWYSSTKIRRRRRPLGGQQLGVVAQRGERGLDQLGRVVGARAAERGDVLVLRQHRAGRDPVGAGPRRRPSAARSAPARPRSIARISRSRSSPANAAGRQRRARAPAGQGERPLARSPATSSRSMRSCSGPDSSRGVGSPSATAAMRSTPNA